MARLRYQGRSNSSSNPTIQLRRAERSRLIENSDNLTVVPWNELFVCEDRGSKPGGIIGVTPEGGPFVFAACHLKSELAGATAHAGRAYTVARAFTTVETAWSMGEAGVNFYQGDAGLGDALAFAPGAGYIAGRLSDGLGLFKCFVGDTQVVIREADSTPIVAAMPAAPSAKVGSTDESGVWLAAAMVPIGIAGSRVLRRRKRRRDSDDAADGDFSNLDGINRDAIDVNRCLELHSQACPAHPAEDFDVEDNTLADLHDQAFCSLDNGALDNLVCSETEPRTRPITEPVVSPRRPSRRRSRTLFGGSNLLATAWLLGCLLLGGMFFLGQSDSSAISPQAVASPAAALPIDATLSDQKYVTRSIREIRIGDRVLAHNPEVTETERAEAVEPDATWRHVRLEMDKPDGSKVRIQLLRPRSWLTAQAASIGSTIQLDLEEMGASGPARVTEVTSCPPLASGPGEVVTGTFAHSAGNVIDLSVEGLEQPIGTTDNHPFWSEDRQEFVPAGELRIGERLRTEDGQLLAVTASTPRAVKERVFNLEVNTEHVYFVATKGVLVHNSYSDTVADSLGAAQREAIRRYGLPTTLSNNVESVPQFGRNPNLLGPNGEPWGILRVLDVDGNVTEIIHHSNGHLFNDIDPPFFEPPHFHGPDGEHIFY